MARIAFNQARYQLFIAAFLRYGPRYAQVAKEVGCDIRTVRKAWEIGWPEKTYGRPIRDVWRELTSDVAIQRAALEPPRAAVREAESATESVNVQMPQSDIAIAAAANTQENRDPIETALDKVKNSAIGALAKEADMLSAARSNAIGLFVLSNHLLSGMQPLAITVARKLRALGEDGDVNAVNPMQTLKLLERLTKIIGASAEVAEKLVRVQRLHAGAPTEIHESRKRETPSAEQNAETLQGLARSLSVLQRSGALPGDVAQADAPYEGEETGGT